jgi:hypothetical protein
MNARFLHPSGTDRTVRPLHDDTIEMPASVPGGRACCCPARAVVRVIMAPTPARPHSVDLLLCGHHYRASRQALAAAKATVTELPRPHGGPATALLPDLPGPRMPVS